MDEVLTANQNSGNARLLNRLAYAPGLVAGVFLSRVIGEWLGLPGEWAAVGLGVLGGVVGARLLAHLSLSRTWPALILLAYVVYPESYPLLAWKVVAVTLLSFGLNASTRRDRALNSTTPDAFRSSRAEFAVAGLVAIVAFVVYLITLAPDVLAADSGELQVVAAQLGVAHPPGFPLYVMIAHLFTRLMPLTAPAFAVNLFSAVTSALTVALVYLTSVHITRQHLSSLIAAFALASATTFWSQATTANVRSLTGLFAALILFGLICFRSAVVRDDPRAADRWLTLVALFMGFGLTHHISLVFLIAVGLGFVVILDPAIIRSPRRWVRPVTAGLLGLLPLLYLPLRAFADARRSSPDLATWPGFVEHALATGFRGDLFYYISPADVLQRLRIMGNVLSFQFDAVILAGMLVGMLILFAKDKALAWLLGGVFAVFTLVAATYRAPQTVEYMIPAYLAAVLLLGYGLKSLPEVLGRIGIVGPAIFSLYMAVVIVVVVSQSVVNRTASGIEHEGLTVREYAVPLLQAAPEGSMLLAHWHWATPLWYLQEVEGLRPDVDVEFVFPEGDSYDATWERRARDAFATGRPVITTWVPTAQLADMPIPEPLGEALLYPQEPRLSLPHGYTEGELSLGDSVRVIGYRVEQPVDSVVGGDEVVVTVAWLPIAEIPSQLGLFVHLIGPDGVLYGQDDKSVAAAAGITLTQFRATLRPGAPMGVVSIYVGTTGAEIDRVVLTDMTVSPAKIAPFSRNPLARRWLDESGTTLIGYDWDHTLPDRSRLYLHWRNAAGNNTQVIDDAAINTLELPPYRGPWGVPVGDWQFHRGREGGHYVPLGQGIVWTGETLNGLSLRPGESIVIDQAFHSARPINRDYVVSVRLIGLEDDGIHWNWWDLQDSIPAMGAIPTLKWVDGSFVRSPHRVTVAEDAWPEQALTGALTLYDAFTNRALPILDERITAANPWVPLCQGLVRAAAP